MSWVHKRLQQPVNIGRVALIGLGDLPQRCDEVGPRGGPGVGALRCGLRRAVQQAVQQAKPWQLVLGAGFAVGVVAYKAAGRDIDFSRLHRWIQC